MKQYSIFTVTDESYKYYKEVFFKSLNKINMDLVKKVYVCDQGMSEGQRDFVKSFDKVQIINPVNKINEKTGKDCGCNKRKDTLNRLFPYNN